MLTEGEREREREREKGNLEDRRKTRNFLIQFCIFSFFFLFLYFGLCKKKNFKQEGRERGGGKKQRDISIT